MLKKDNFNEFLKLINSWYFFKNEIIRKIEQSEIEQKGINSINHTPMSISILPIEKVDGKTVEQKLINIYQKVLSTKSMYLLNAAIDQSLFDDTYKALIDVTFATDEEKKDLYNYLEELFEIDIELIEK